MSFAITWFTSYKCFFRVNISLWRWILWYFSKGRHVVHFMGFYYHEFIIAVEWIFLCGDGFCKVLTQTAELINHACYWKKSADYVNSVFKLTSICFIIVLFVFLLLYRQGDVYPPEQYPYPMPPEHYERNFNFREQQPSPPRQVYRVQQDVSIVLWSSFFLPY